MQHDPHYGDVVAEVRDYLAERAANAQAAGVGEVWIDPGIGFGKTDDHNLSLLRHVHELTATGLPVAVGVSRKGFLGRLTGNSAVEDRREASLAAATWAMLQGVGLIRVHDVAPTLQAARLAGVRAPASQPPMGRGGAAPGGSGVRA